MEVAALAVVLLLVLGSRRAGPTESEDAVPAPVSSPLAIRALSFAPAHRLRDDAATAAERAVAESSAPRITSSFRSTEQQTALYELWKAGRGNLAAPPGKSLHERGLALDARGSAEWERAMERHGWHRPIVDVEPWHWEYRT